MTTRSKSWLGAISLFALASCGGEFTTAAANGPDAGEGGSVTTGGGTSTGGARSTGGRTGSGGSLNGKGGVQLNTGGFYQGGSVGAGGATSSSEDAFRIELTKLYCATFAPCCADGGVFLDATQCQASLSTLIASNLSSSRNGYYTYD